MRKLVLNKALTIVVSALLLTLFVSTSCKQERRQAQKVANDFMTHYLSDSQIRGCHFSKLDSSMVVSDSILEQLRTKARNNEMFNNDITFDESKAKLPIYYISATYSDQEGTEHRITFYLNSSLDHVISVKAY